MMGKVVSLLLSRGAGIFVGIASILLVIWFAGHYVGLDTITLKLMAMGAVIGVYLVYLAIKTIVQSRRGKKLEKDLVASSSIGSELQQKLDETLQKIRQSDLGQKYRGKSALYVLPWYMVIGPSAAGKSTLFSRSGLNFPLQDDQRFHLEGIGGTQNCDWWFSDEAILIDTAGRYTVEEDTQEWTEFLRLLKQYRSKAPVNGVVLALPVEELLLSDDSAVENHVKNLRNRIDEVVRELGVLFPIYVVLTKCDQIEGFTEFFADLSETERSQPWGAFLLDETEDKAANVFDMLTKRIQALTDRLFEQRWQKAELADNEQARARIHQFPYQFQAASDRLSFFFEKLLKVNPYHETPWFAGVYFTSSTTGNSTIAQVSDPTGTHFEQHNRQTASADAPSGMFVGRLFSDVILPLKKAVRGNRRRQRVHRWAKLGLFTSLAGISAFAGVTLTTVYNSNQAVVGEYSSEADNLVDRFNDTTSTPLQRLDALASLFTHYQNLQRVETLSPLQMLGQSELTDTHAEPMKKLVQDAITRYVEGQIAPALQNRLSGYNTEWVALGEVDRSTARASYYETLQTYLMLTSHSDFYEREQVAQSLARIWLDSFAGDDIQHVYDERLPELANMIALYLVETHEPRAQRQSEGVWLASADLVPVAQDNLRAKADEQSLYAQLITTADDRYDAVQINQIVRPKYRSAIVANNTVSGAYTRDAWDGYIRGRINSLAKMAASGDWVTGAAVADPGEIDPRKESELKRALREQYFFDYVEQWKGFIAGLDTPNYRDLSEAVNSIKALSDGEEGPLKTVFDEAARNMLIREVAPESNGLTDLAAKAQGSEEGETSVPEVPVIASFRSQASELFELLAPANDASGSALLADYTAELIALAGELEVLAVSADADKEAKDYASAILSGRGSSKQLYAGWIAINNRLDEASAPVRDMMRELMTDPLRRTWSGIVANAARSLQQDYENKLYGAYNRSLRGKFPFSANGSTSATFDDIDTFVGDGGALWAFVEDDLSPYVEQRGGSWRSRSWLGRSVSISSSFFAAVAKAEEVKNAVYSSDGMQGMRLGIYPEPARGVSESLLRIGNQEYRYRNEQQEWRTFEWSPELGSAEIMARGTNGRAPESLEESGSWSFARLLEQADVEFVSGRTFRATWTLGDAGNRYQVSFLLRAERDGSILNSGKLSGFALPRQLVES